MKTELKKIAVTCKAFELLDKLNELNPGQKKYALVSELIESAYSKLKTEE